MLGCTLLIHICAAPFLIRPQQCYVYSVVLQALHIKRYWTSSHHRHWTQRRQQCNGSVFSELWGRQRNCKCLWHFRCLKLLINKLYVICFICTVTMSFTLHVEVGAFGHSISKISRNLFLPTNFFLLHKRTQTAITCCHPQKSRINSSTQTSEECKLPPQASWEHNMSDVCDCSPRPLNCRESKGYSCDFLWNISLCWDAWEGLSSPVTSGTAVGSRVSECLHPLSWVSGGEPQNCWCPRFFSK